MTREEMSNKILKNLKIERISMNTPKEGYSRWCYVYEHMKYMVSIDENNKRIAAEQLQSCDPNVPEIMIRYGEIFLNFSEFKNVPVFSFEEMCWKIKTGTWLRKRAAEDLKRREEIL